jgi:DNA invertase Pin-like site-specific DNA recombinase
MQGIQERVKGWAVYLRASTQQPEEAFENQRAAISEEIMDSDMEVVAEYRDVQSSGEAMQKLLADARAGHFSHVVIFSIDRLGHTTDELRRNLADIQGAGVRLHIVSRYTPTHLRKA